MTSHWAQLLSSPRDQLGKLHGLVVIHSIIFLAYKSMPSLNCTSPNRTTRSVADSGLQGLTDGIQALFIVAML